MKTNSKKLCSLLLACAMMVTTVVSASAAKVSGMEDDAAETVITAGNPETFYVDGAQITIAVVPAGEAIRPRVSHSATASQDFPFTDEYTCRADKGSYGCVSITNDTRDNEMLRVTLRYEGGDGTSVSRTLRISSNEKAYIEATAPNGSGLTGTFYAEAKPVSSGITLPLYYSAYQK